MQTYTHEAFQRGVQDPYEALKQGFGHCSNTGSSTAIVLMLDVNRLLAANVGDSGFRVVRGDELVFASEPQQHSFNFPFQVAGEILTHHAGKFLHIMQVFVKLTAWAQTINNCVG